MKHSVDGKKHSGINKHLLQKLCNTIIVLMTLFYYSNVYSQYKIPETPELQTSVYDYINLLSPSQKSSLENKLIKYSDSTSTQIVVAVISSTNGDYINALGTNWAHKWEIGDKNKDNGIFILLAKDDRKINISTGYGVEHLMTDAMSRRIIERDIIPYFKQGDYYGGLNTGVNSIFEVMTGEYKGTRQSANEGIPFGLIFLFIIFIIILISVSKNRRGGGGSGGRRYRSSTSRSILETIILSNAGRSSSGGGFGGGFGGGSSGGGGFGGGFGGGGFGGGGASGGW